MRVLVFLNTFFYHSTFHTIPYFLARIIVGVISIVIILGIILRSNTAGFTDLYRDLNKNSVSLHVLHMFSEAYEPTGPPKASSKA